MMHEEEGKENKVEEESEEEEIDLDVLEDDEVDFGEEEI